LILEPFCFTWWALRLNNKYELDGRDPNGFTGVAWCLGKHDRPWGGRPIFGNVRYMSADGLNRKFDADKYAQKYASANTKHSPETKTEDYNGGTVGSHKLAFCSIES